MESNSVVYNSPINITEAWGRGKQVFMKNWGALAIVVFVPLIISILFSALSNSFPRINGLITLVSMVVSVWLSFNSLVIFLKAYDGKEFSPDELFASPTKQLGTVLLAEILIGLVFAVLGVVLIGIPVFMLVPTLIIHGNISQGYIIYSVVSFLVFFAIAIYLGLKYMFFCVLIVDKNVGLMESFKLSSIMTKGKKAELFIFGLATGFMVIGLMILGFIFFIIGFFPAYLFAAIVSEIAQIHVYRNLYAKYESTIMPLEVPVV